MDKCCIISVGGNNGGCCRLKVLYSTGYYFIH